MNQAIAKAKSRSHFKALRSQQLPVVETSIVQQVAKTLQLKYAKLQGHLGIYWPITGEVDLRALQTTLKSPLALPASKADGSLSYHPWRSTPLQNDACMIPAPLNEPVLEASEIGLLLIPALAMDQLGVRLGYGGGFYDRLRGDLTWRKIPALAVLPQACISTELLPRDHWDVPLDGWITEAGITRVT
tara:strand:- start:169 stop:732 length:564 start_codon:yes stop_codon:yes gene_type:complete